MDFTSQYYLKGFSISRRHFQWSLFRYNIRKCYRTLIGICFRCNITITNADLYEQARSVNVALFQIITHSVISSRPCVRRTTHINLSCECGTTCYICCPRCRPFVKMSTKFSIPPKLVEVSHLNTISRTSRGIFENNNKIISSLNSISTNL
jgi:hypothetical protein